MRVRVRFFAGAREAAGAPHEDVELPEGATVADALERVGSARPRVAAYRPHSLLARNGAFVDERARLSDGDEVALMPPVSGGDGSAQDPATLDAAPFSLDDLVARTATEGAGAVVTFTGIVRPTSAQRPDARVERLEFEAYEPMARQELARVREEAVAKFDLVDATLHHRLGRIDAGESVVAVVVAARHRQEAFEAAAWIMDELKTRVPVWKREVDADGARRWINDPVSTQEEPK